MTLSSRAISFASIAIVVCSQLLSSASSQTPKVATSEQELNRRLQRASADFDAGRIKQAVAELESLLSNAPQSFEIHELLGLAYAAESQDAKASPHLAKAVQLKPESAVARTNLAANYARLGKLDRAEEQLKRAVILEPDGYDANHNLGEIYVRTGKLQDAVPLLRKAQTIKPDSYDNGYDLALAYLYTGNVAPAEQLVQRLLQTKDTAELHNLLGHIEEKGGKFVPAVNDFEAAAHQDPSEDNLFDWASELLLHQTLEPAIEVLRDAAKRYPSSSRLAIGLGIAYYSRGIYDEAVESLLRAADLSPSDSRCYLFLSKAYDSSPGQADEVIQRFHHYAELHPNDPHAAYYYAMSLWKGKRAQDPNVDFHQIEQLLKRAITLDPKVFEAHLQLGNLYSDQSRYAEAIPEYLKALENNPDLPDAHYRLGQAYVHAGEKDKAQAQLAIYQEQRAQHLAEVDKQRAEIRQFVYSEQNQSSSRQ